MPGTGTTIVKTSPLQAAREWRGIPLVVAARNSGLSLAHAEALEEGRIDGFSCVDEMVASAIVYSASLGIGRDEAVALLDRTLAGNGFPVPEGGVPAAVPPMAGLTDFSTAVRAHGAALSGVATGVSAALDPAGFDNRPAANPPRIDAAAANRASTFASIEIDAPVATAPAASDMVFDPIDMPVVAAPPVQLRAPDDVEFATGEIPAALGDVSRTIAGAPSEPVRAALELDDEYRRAWEQSQNELEAWASGHAIRSSGGSRTLRRVGLTLDRWVTAAFGEQRSSRLFDRRAALAERTREGIAVSRERLRESEHATLIVAVAGGVVLIALLVAIASALGGGDSTPVAPSTAEQKAAEATPVGRTPTATPTSDADEPAAKPAAGDEAGAKPAGGTKPMLAPAAIQLQVLNAGSTKGKANALASLLRSRGYTVAKVGNSRSDYNTPVILYPKQYQREAERLSRQTQITTIDTFASAGNVPAMTIVIV